MKKPLLFSILFFFSFQLSIHSQCLSGTYTIGGTSADFPSFKDATDALQQNGICGPVDFKVTAGIYTDPSILLAQVNGSSAINTITLEGPSNDSTAVMLKGTNTTLLTIEGSNIIVKHIGFSLVSTFNYGKSLSVSGSPENVTIRNCYFRTKNATAIDASSAAQHRTLIIATNYFVSDEAGSAILVNMMHSNELTAQLLISKNTIEEFLSPITVLNTDSLTISDNTILSSHGNEGIRLATPFNYLISKNKIKGTFMSGISIEQAPLNSSCTRTVTTNFIYNKGKYGINFTNVEGCGIVNNTINLVGNNDGVVINLNNGGYCGLENNVLNSTGHNILFQTEKTNAITMNYNNYHTRSDTMFFLTQPPAVFHDLAEWKSVNTFNDEYSISFPPQFISADDFHLKDYNINDKGKAVFLNEDLDGEIRGPKPDIGADEYTLAPLANDAGLAIADTTTNACDNTVRPVFIKLINTGTNPLTTALIKWSFKSVVQTLSWTGSIAVGKSLNIKLGEINSIYDQSEAVIAYINLVNSVTDLNTGNDTLHTRPQQPSLSGNYTVGTGGSFKNLKQLADYLNHFGICGPVVFTLKKGTHETNAVFNSISGSSAVHTITFQSETTNPDDVVIYQGSGAGEAIGLQNSNYIRFKDLTIESWGSAPIAITACKYISFDHLKFTSYTGITASSELDYKLAFTNCTFECPLSVYANSGFPSKKGLLIDKCIFNSSNGLYLGNVDSVTVSNTQFNCTSAISNNYGIYVNSCKDISIFKNYIKGGFKTGIKLNAAGSSAEPVSVTNNAVVGSSQTTQSIAVDNSHYVNLIYNTCSSNNSTNGEPINIAGSNTNIKLVNNIFSNLGNGPSANVGDAAAFSQADYNAFYTKGAYQIAFQGQKSFADYKTISGLEQHSVFSNPDFIPGTKLYFANDTIRGIATPLVSITDDIENKLRDITKPTPGAYESRPDTVFDYIHKDLQVSSISNTLVIGSNTISVTLKSNALKDINNYNVHRGSIDTIDVSYKLNSDGWITEQWIGKLNVNQSLNYNFTNKLNIANGKIYRLIVKAKVHGKLIDINPSNDSLVKQVVIPMAGAYLIGGNMPDFENEDTALASLKICHEIRQVTFVFRPGNYKLLNIEGTDTLTLRSETGNSDDVKIQCNRIHASNLTFKKVAILPRNNTSGDIYEGMGIETYTKKFTVDSCSIYGFDGSSTFFSGFCFISSENVTITHSQFQNCQAAIIYNSVRNVNGSIGGWGPHHEISNNYFFGNKTAFLVQGQTANNYDIDPADSINFHNNEISGVNGVLLTTTHKVLLKFYNNNVGGESVPLTIEHVPNSILFYNNFFGSRYDIAVQLTKTKNQQFIHNSLQGPISMSSASGILMKNSSVYAAERAAFVMDDSSSYTGDYNNYYVNSFVLGQLFHNTSSTYTDLKNLDSLKAAISQEQHSISFNPYYKGFTDLHANSIFLKNKGVPVSFIHTDIDGQSRNATAPDIGADEIDVSTDVVWPGDADADSRVNGKDLLSIGLYNGKTGISRGAGVTNSWQGQQAADWASTQYNTVNLKHADCNGDGKIDGDDTLAISLNYGRYHGSNQRPIHPEVMSPGNDLYFIMKNPKSAYNLDDTIKVEVWLGKAILTVADAYGISFDVAVPPASIKPGTFNLALSKTWLGNPYGSSANAFGLVKNDEPAGIGSGAFVRNNHTGVSGYGKIATLSFVSVGTAPNENIYLNFENVYVLDSKGNELIINSHNNSATNYKGDIPTGITTAENPDGLLSVAPNPFSDHTSIQYTLSHSSFVKMDVYDNLGQLVKTIVAQQQNAGMHQIDFDARSESHLQNGIYFIKLTTGEKVTVQKMVIE